MDQMLQIFKLLETDVSTRDYTMQRKSFSQVSITTQSLLFVIFIWRNTEKLLQLQERQTMYPLGRQYVSHVSEQENSVLLLPAVLKLLSTLIILMRLLTTTLILDISHTLCHSLSKALDLRMRTLEFSPSWESCTLSTYLRR